MEMSELEQYYGDVPFIKVEGLYPDFYNKVKESCFPDTKMEGLSVFTVITEVYSQTYASARRADEDRTHNLMFLLDNLYALVNKEEI